MSAGFRIRPLFKTNNQPNNLLSDDNEVSVPSSDDMEKMKDAVLNFRKRSSHKSLISNSDLQEAMRNSSISLGGTKLKDAMDNMLKHRENVSDTTTPIDFPVGFSSRSIHQSDNDLNNQLIEQEFNDAISDSITSKIDTEEKEKKNVELAKAKRAIIYGYPARAALLRGSHQRTIGKQGGIRMTATGQPDAY